MYNKKYSVFLSKNSENHATVFVAEKNLYAVFEIKKIKAQEYLKDLAHAIRKELLFTEINSAHDIERLIQEQTNELYSTISFACCYIQNETVYVATNKAIILLRTNNNLYAIAQNHAVKHGAIHTRDTLYLLTSSFNKKLPQLLQILRLQNSPKEIINTIKKQEGYDNEPGLACIIIQHQKQEEIVPDTAPAVTIAPTVKDTKEKSSVKSKITLPNRSIMLRILIGIILISLLFSGALYLSKQISKKQQLRISTSITKTQTLLNSISSELENKPKIAADKLGLIEQDISKLQKESLNQGQKKQIEKLLNQAKDLRKQIGSSKTTKTELFFDARLIDENAQIKTMAVGNNIIILFDSANKSIYTISPQDKSYETYPIAKDTNPLYVGVVNENPVYLDKKKGIYLYSENRFKKIIAKKNNYKAAQALQTYGGNIYVLDSQQDEIFKFTPIKDGYSNALSYFRPGQAINLNTAKGLAINFYVFVLTDSAVYKYNAGIQNKFNVADSVNTKNVAKIFARPDDDNIYLLDNTKGRIIILDKNGDALQTVFNPNLRNIKHFGVVNERNILFLRNNKLFTLDNL